MNIILHRISNNLINRISKHNKDIRIVRIRDKENDNKTDEYSPESIVYSFLEWTNNQPLKKEVKEIINSELSDCEDKSLEKALALSANIVGITCNRLAAYDFRDSTEMFDVAIIDEVCKATLPEVLAPLIVSKKAILLGDPKQLPPLFCSEELDVIRRISGCNLNRYTYIDELLRSKKAVKLNTQYRMTKEIANVISNTFYDGQLKDGRNVSNDKGLKWITYEPSRSWPIDSEEPVKQQIFNEDESAIILDIISKHRDGSTIAIIAPYQAQVQLLRRTIGHLEGVSIDTVDGFQGKEADVVIFSMTRTHGSYRFMADPRRLNVALSRARNQIIIVGEQNYCKENSLLKSLLDFFSVESNKKVNI